MFTVENCKMTTTLKRWSVLLIQIMTWGSCDVSNFFFFLEDVSKIQITWRIILYHIIECKKKTLLTVTAKYNFIGNKKLDSVIAISMYIKLSEGSIFRTSI